MEASLTTKFKSNGSTKARSSGYETNYPTAVPVGTDGRTERDKTVQARHQGTHQQPNHQVGEALTAVP